MLPPVKREIGNSLGLPDEIINLSVNRCRAEVLVSGYEWARAMTTDSGATPLRLTLVVLQGGSGWDGHSNGLHVWGWDLQLSTEGYVLISKVRYVDNLISIPLSVIPVQDIRSLNLTCAKLSKAKKVLRSGISGHDRDCGPTATPHGQLQLIREETVHKLIQGRIRTGF